MNVPGRDDDADGFYSVVVITVDFDSTNTSSTLVRILMHEVFASYVIKNDAKWSETCGIDSSSNTQPISDHNGFPKKSSRLFFAPVRDFAALESFDFWTFFRSLCYLG